MSAKAKVAQTKFGQAKVGQARVRNARLGPARVGPARVGQTKGAQTSFRRARRQRNIREARRAILDAAARVFAKRGYHGTTMEDVAREAGYSVGSIYTYFAGKEQLYAALSDAVEAEFAALDREPPPPSVPFAARLQALLRRQFEIVEKHRSYYVTFYPLRLDEEQGVIGRRARDKRKRWIARAEALIEEGIARGAIRADGPPVAEMAQFMLAVVQGAVSRWIKGELPTDLPAHAPVLIDLLLRGLRARSGRGRTS